MHGANGGSSYVRLLSDTRMGRLYNRAHQTPLRQHLRTHGTPAEARLWTLLQNRQVGGRRFRRQHGVGPYVVDFYCPSERLAVEVDGAVHDTPERAAYDAARTRHLAEVGIRVLRVSNRAVFEGPAGVVAAVASAFRSA